MKSLTTTACDDCSLEYRDISGRSLCAAEGFRDVTGEVVPPAWCPLREGPVTVRAPALELAPDGS